MLKKMLRNLGLPSKCDLRIKWAENRVCGEKGDQNAQVHIKIFTQDVKVCLHIRDISFCAVGSWQR